LDAFINVLKESHVTFINNNFSSLQEVLLNLSKNKLSDLWEKQFNEIKKYDLLKNMEKFIYIYSKL